MAHRVWLDSRNFLATCQHNDVTTAEATYVVSRVGANDCMASFSFRACLTLHPFHVRSKSQSDVRPSRRPVFLHDFEQTLTTARTCQSRAEAWKFKDAGFVD